MAEFLRRFGQPNAIRNGHPTKRSALRSVLYPVLTGSYISAYFSSTFNICYLILYNYCVMLVDKKQDVHMRVLKLPYIKLSLPDC